MTTSDENEPHCGATERRLKVGVNRKREVMIEVPAAMDLPLGLTCTATFMVDYHVDKDGDIEIDRARFYDLGVYDYADECVSVRLDDRDKVRCLGEFNARMEYNARFAQEVLDACREYEADIQLDMADACDV